MKKPEWYGVLPAVVTQFNEDCSVNFQSTLNHIEFLLASGIEGLVMLGTCGENNSLEAEEKIQILRETVKFVNGRVPVISGTSELTTAKAISFAKAVVDTGVDGLMVLPAMAYVSDHKETVEHFKVVARAVPETPIMIYNNPVSYRIDVTVDMLKDLTNIDNIVCIKESSNDPRRITDLYNTFGDRFEILAGVDDLAFESIVLGATGWISGLVNAFPAEDKLLWDLIKDKRFEDALKVYRWYTPLLHMDTVPKLVQLIKLACVEVGIGSEKCRPPRLEISGQEREAALKIIKEAIANRPLRKDYY
ncbi:MAG: dihydrodipicolinate synthase family protein [Lentisphaeraceae bacterium]|nr:dihydrodipicolinate synthase family protein [Lentisphaeraceae bacterium]